LYHLFKSYELERIGQLVVLASLYGLLVMPLYQVGKFFYVPGRIEQVKKPHFYTSLGILTAVLLAVIFLPLPHSVICTLEVQARKADSVYVVVPGVLESIDVKPGQHVTKGQQLAQLSNPDVDMEVAKLQGTVNEYKIKLQSLRQQSIRDRRAASQVGPTAEALKTAEEQLAEKIQDHQRLRLVAPEDGYVLPPQMTPSREDPEEKLPMWSGTPLESHNLGASLEPNVLFCQVGDPKSLEAVLVVDQADRNLVKEGDLVDIKLEGFPSTTIHSEIEEIAGSELKISPPRLATKHGGELPTKTDPHTGVERPQSTSYQARVPIEDPEAEYPLGQRGQARVYTRWLSLGDRFWRMLSQTFNFKM
jgi:putative peptide zinc metalloprotease protein